MEILEDRDQWLAGYQAGWFAHYRRTGETDWTSYDHPWNSTAPQGPGVDLAESRLLLISSAGAYLPGQQQPFDAGDPLGDYTTRLFPASTPFDELAIAHEHYDQAAVNQDPQVLLPLGHLADLVARGTIGELATSVVSFMGYQPDATRVVDETCPAIVRAAQEEGAQAALLVPA